MEKLKTNELSSGLDRTFRNDLVDNFTIIENALNVMEDTLNTYLLSEGDKAITANDLSKQLTDLKEELNNRMNFIVLGTDDSAIELVVKKILKDEGVIK
ncbi:hypothetical protein [Leuconostoc mesenteroides]|uniref:hypothetical protein n=1 Tax=Leuconostoc mesenteroides TaxID=1245 RepID=UPI00235E95F0|nr:hypothetical protein [Leuconostoc mesenteroides]